MASIPVVLALGQSSNKPIAANRILLLEGIASSGSIMKAAALAEMSYRAALLSIDDLEQLCGCALVTRTVGGRHGGGAELTEDGGRLVAACRLIESFQQELAGKLGNRSDLFSACNRLTLNTSARNHLPGTVESVAADDGIVDVVTVRISPTDTLQVNVTRESAESLGLQTGSPVTLLIKAPHVRLHAAVQDRATNRLQASASVVRRSDKRVCLQLSLADGVKLTAIAPIDELGPLLISNHGAVAIAIDPNDILIGI